MTSAISASVSAVAAGGVNIQFLDPTPGYRAGGHFICDQTGAASTNAWVNGITAPSSSGSGGGFPFPGSGSFHPTAAGQQYYADLINQRLTAP